MSWRLAGILGTLLIALVIWAEQPQLGAVVGIPGASLSGAAAPVAAAPQSLPVAHAVVALLQR